VIAVDTWRSSARCLEINEPTQTFFPAQGDHETLKRAKTICASCPVRLECLTDCLDTPQEHDWHGIYAGVGPRARNALRQERDRLGSEFRLVLPEINVAGRPRGGRRRRSSDESILTSLRWNAETQRYVTTRSAEDNARLKREREQQRRRGAGAESSE
jgi:WhiB family redox-sensing transcriptional regulator